MTDINRSAITQLIRSATAVGANYQEANASMSKKDFQHKIAICRKEAKEAHFWLLTLHAFIDVESIKLNELTQESKELILIFSRIFVTSRGQKK